MFWSVSKIRVHKRTQEEWKKKGQEWNNRERESGTKETNDIMMKKCKVGETNTKWEDIYAMKAGVGVNLDPSPIVALWA